jgi:SsrA-binding protein
MALVPLKIYFTKSFAKVLLGVGKGKSEIDKRETLKRKTAEREIQRALRDSRKK